MINIAVSYTAAAGFGLVAFALMGFAVLGFYFAGYSSGVASKDRTALAERERLKKMIETLRSDNDRLYSAVREGPNTAASDAKPYIGMEPKELASRIAAGA